MTDRPVSAEIYFTKGIRREGERKKGRENKHQNPKGKTSVSFKATRLVMK